MTQSEARSILRVQRWFLGVGERPGLAYLQAGELGPVLCAPPV